MWLLGSVCESISAGITATAQQVHGPSCSRVCLYRVQDAKPISQRPDPDLILSFLLRRLLNRDLFPIQT